MKRIYIFIFIAFGICNYIAAQEDVKLPEKPNRAKYVDYSTKDKGFWCAVEAEVGSSVVFNSTNAQRAGISYTGGYYFNEFLKVGVGIGANYYFNNNDNLRDTGIEWTMPIFANIRGNIISQESREMVPFWSFSAGGAIRDGLFLSPAIGLRFGELRNAFLLGLGYTLSEIDAKPGKSKATSFFTLKLGYEF